jgi:deazaflavin-dependent oxidoreductase (nitroreductase family)
VVALESRARNGALIPSVLQGMADWNAKIIDEFRANEGRVGGPFKGHQLLLLHHKGAKTGKERINPLAAQTLGDGAWAVFASKGGAPTNPDWFYNLVANPDAIIEIGTETVRVRARVPSDAEREPIWTRQKKIMPGFAEYEKKTTRQIPVVILEGTHDLVGGDTFELPTHAL